MKYVFMILTFSMLTMISGNAYAQFGGMGGGMNVNPQMGGMAGNGGGNMNGMRGMGGMGNSQMGGLTTPTMLGLYNVENTIRFAFPGQFSVRAANGGFRSVGVQSKSTKQLKRKNRNAR
jgi:uncharacterized membrane protein